VTAMRVELATCLKQFCFSTTRHFFWRTGEWKLAHGVSPMAVATFPLCGIWKRDEHVRA